MYGESEQGLAETLKESVEDAKVTMDKVLGAMPQLARVIDLVHDFAEQRGYVETILGHRRRLPEVKLSDYGAKSRALRQSFNAVIQGSGANVTNTALISIREYLREHNLKSKIVATVHDSIVVDVPKEELMIVPKVVKYLMEHVKLPNFILDIDKYPSLKVDDKYKISDTQFRFPLFAEIEFGRVYGEELDFDEEKIKSIGIDKYLEYAQKEKLINNTFNTKLGKLEEEQAKEKLIQEHEEELKSLETTYFESWDIICYTWLKQLKNYLK